MFLHSCAGCSSELSRKGFSRELSGISAVGKEAPEFAPMAVFFRRELGVSYIVEE
jgi:hypothetical protein